MQGGSSANGSPANKSSAHNKENQTSQAAKLHANAPFSSSLFFPGPAPALAAASHQEPVAVKAEPATNSEVPPATTTRIAPSPTIILTYEGNYFNCYLDELTEDPKSVIEVLTQTSAQATHRDKWMIVAGYYRGKGNIKAALAVVKAMVDGKLRMWHSIRLLTLL